MINWLLKLLPSKTIYAHCDIPCGIYDPHNMQMASHTVIRMTDLIKKEPDPELKSDEAAVAYTNKVVRMIKVKEDHAEILKKELAVLWSDYFKPEHIEKFPELHDLVWKTMKLASKTKQEVNLEASEELLANTQKIAEIFFETKGLKSKKVKAPYPTEREIVVQD